MEYLKVRGDKKALRYRDIIRGFSMGNGFNELCIPTIKMVYKKPSFEKMRAYRECRQFAFAYADFLRSRGFAVKVIDWGVISYNVFKFTFSMVMEISNEEGGLPATRIATIITPNEKFDIVLG